MIPLKQKTKEHFQDLVYPFILIVLLGILFSIIIYFVTNTIIEYDVLVEPDKDKKLDALIKIIGISISITGFLSIIVTIIQTKKSVQRDIQQTTIHLFKEFNSDSFRDKRTRGWEVMEKWYSEDGYKKRFLEYNLGETITTKDEELGKDIRAIYTLLEFYLVVSVNGTNKDLLKAVRYFYYGWWRHFLYDIGEELENLRKVDNILLRRDNDYLKSISYIEHLNKLDKLCGLENIPTETKLHLNGI